MKSWTTSGPYVLLTIGVVMSNLPLLVIIGVIAILVLCFVHGRVETAMPRSKFVVLSLFGLGSLPLGYVALWVIADQQPSFSLVPFVAFGATLWATALTYSVVSVLLKKDIAPSH